jgi:hypothetical protein
LSQRTQRLYRIYVDPSMRHYSEDEFRTLQRNTKAVNAQLQQQLEDERLRYRTSALVNCANPMQQRALLQDWGVH